MKIDERLGCQRGVFIVLEGIDGAGTTTRGDRLTARIQQQHRVFFTNEPSSGPAGMLIRLALARRLMGPALQYHDAEMAEREENAGLDPRTMALLFAADRSDHLATKIEPNLRQGKIVICDRYILSSLAYQGIDLPLRWLIQVNALFRTPDITFFIDVPVDHARLRMRSARWAKDLYEDQETLKRVKAAYHKVIADRVPCVGAVVTVDGSLRPREVTSQILHHIHEVLEKKGVINRRGHRDLFNP